MSECIILVKHPDYDISNFETIPGVPSPLTVGVPFLVDTARNAFLGYFVDNGNGYYSLERDDSDYFVKIYLSLSQAQNDILFDGFLQYVPDTDISIHNNIIFHPSMWSLIVPLVSGGSSSKSPFVVPDLDGNFGAYPKGTVVNVTSRSGDFIVEASQFMWAFPSSDFMGSCIVYYLSQNGKNILVPDFLLTLKAAS